MIEMEMIIEPLEILNKPSFNSNSSIPWKEVREGNIIYHEGDVYEVAFKSVRKTAVDGHLLESNKILYLRPLFDGENVMGIIDEDGYFSLMLANFKKNIGTGEVSPYTSSFHESWTEEWLDSLKKELNEKIKNLRSRMR